MQLVLKLLVTLIIAFFIIVGLVITFNPAGFLIKPDVALVPDGAAGLSFARSVIGGHFLGMALLSIYSLRKRANTVFYLMGGCVSFIVLGRFVGLIMDGFNPNIVGGLILEISVMTILYATGRFLQPQD